MYSDNAMTSELVFKIIIIVVYTFFSVIRIRYQVLASKSGYVTIIEESRKYSVYLSIFICYEVVTLFIFLLFPNLLGWAGLSLPLWLRWSGVLLAVSSLLSFIWVHQNLDKNYSPLLKIKDKQFLVESGSYRCVRHPMYTAFYILHIASFLLTANWFIGLTWIAGLTVIIATRVKKEEEMLVKKFGESYISYMDRTGRFIPLIRWN